MEIKPKKITILPISNLELQEQPTVIPKLVLAETFDPNEENPLDSIITNDLPKAVNIVQSTENLLEHCEPIPDIDKLKEKLNKLGIRFNTDPKVYQKRDYWLLICILYLALTRLYKYNPATVIVTDWLDPHSDNYVPSEKLVAETIEELDGNLSQEILDRIQAIADEAAIRLEADTNLLNTKQDNLTPGDNISIEDNVISAVDTVYDDTEVRGLIDELDLKVDALGDFECGEIIPTTTNFIEGTEYTIHEALLRTANLFEGYQGEIDDINDLIPNEATASNQLADKDFVLNQIATNAANFRGDWANWTSVPTNANDYPADYTGNKKPNNNDYLIILNAVDYSSSNTGIWRFVYKGDWDTLGKSGWEPQYRVELAFTLELLAAINSGITSLKVSTYDNYQQQIDNLLPLIYAGL